MKKLTIAIIVIILIIIGIYALSNDANKELAQENNQPGVVTGAGADSEQEYSDIETSDDTFEAIDDSVNYME